MAGESWCVLAVDLAVGLGQGGSFFFFFSTAKSAPNSHDASLLLVCAGVLGRSITNLETKGLASYPFLFCSTSYYSTDVEYESG